MIKHWNGYNGPDVIRFCWGLQTVRLWCALWCSRDPFRRQTNDTAGFITDRQWWYCHDMSVPIWLNGGMRIILPYWEIARDITSVGIGCTGLMSCDWTGNLHLFCDIQYTAWIRHTIRTLFCFVKVWHWPILYISYRVTLPALELSCDCPNVIETRQGLIIWLRPNKTQQDCVHIPWNTLNQICDSLTDMWDLCRCGSAHIDKYLYFTRSRY